MIAIQSIHFLNGASGIILISNGSAPKAAARTFGVVMSARRFRISLRQFVHRSRFTQIGLLMGLWLLGGLIARALNLPVPGGIVGMLLALGLLMSGGVSLFSLRRGAQWFLAEMLLFFVPAVLGVLDHPEFLGLLGLKILAIILASTVAVMAATALTVDLIFRWSEKLWSEKHGRLAA